MDEREELCRQREGVVKRMLELTSMRRGTLNEQYVRRREEGAVLGPYYVLSRKQDGRTVSVRVRREEAEQVREDLARHERFTALCREFAEATERLGELERLRAEQAEGVKKKPRSRRNGRPR